MKSRREFLKQWAWTGLLFAPNIARSIPPVTQLRMQVPIPQPKSSSGGIIVPTGLVAYWRFDNNVNDSMGSFNGTAAGTPTYETGKAAQAIVLNGSSQYVTLASNPISNYASSNSVFGWVKTVDITQTQGGYAQNAIILATDANNVLRLTNNAGTMTFLISIGGVDKSRTSKVVDLTNNVWAHIGFTCDGSATPTCYINGSPISTASWSGGGPAPNYILGGRTTATGLWYGDLDEFRIYNVVVSGADVSTLYTQIAFNKFRKSLDYLMAYHRDALEYCAKNNFLQPPTEQHAMILRELV